MPIDKKLHGVLHMGGIVLQVSHRSRLRRPGLRLGMTIWTGT